MSKRNRGIEPIEPQEKKSNKFKLSQALEIPENSFGSVSHIEITGNSEAIIDGCQGILQYDENVIKINTSKMIVKVTGKRLQIKCMTSESAIVSGYITSIEFIIN